MFNIVQILEEVGFNDDEARMYIREHLPHSSVEDHLRLANALNNFPWALEHVCELITNKAISIRQYLEIFNQNKLNYQKTLDGSYCENTSLDNLITVLVVWDSAMSLSQQECKEVILLMQVCGYWHHQNIPQELLDRIWGHELVERILKSLSSSSLIQWDTARRQFSILPILHEITRLKILYGYDIKSIEIAVQESLLKRSDHSINILESKSEHSFLEKATIYLVEGCHFDRNVFDDLELTERLLSHIDAVLSYHEKLQFSSALVQQKMVIKLYWKMANYHFLVRANFEEAKPYFEKLANHSQYAQDWLYLARAYWHLANIEATEYHFEQAKDYYNHANRAFEKIEYGQDSLEDLFVQSEVYGVMLSYDNNIEESLFYYQKSYDLIKDHAQKHASIEWFWANNNLAQLYFKQGDWLQSKDYFLQASKVLEDLFGKYIYKVAWSAGVFYSLEQVSASLGDKNKERFYYQKQLTIVTKKINELIEMFPVNARNRLIDLGQDNSLLSSEQLEMVLACWQFMCQLETDSIEYRVGQSKILFALKRYQEAHTVLEQAFTIDESNVSALHTKIEFLLLQEQPEEALQYLKKLRQEAGEHEASNIYNYIVEGGILIDLKRYEEADTILKQALVIDEGNVDILALRSDLFRALKQYEKALSYSNRARKKNPLYTEAYLRESSDLILLGRHQEAQELLDAYLKMEPDSLDLVVMANKLEIQDELEAALVLSRKFYKENTEFGFHVLADQGRILYKLARYVEAHEVLDKTLRIDNENAAALNTKGLVFEVQGLYGEALNYYRRARQVDQAHPEYWANEGYLLFHQGHYDEANQALDKALLLDEDCVEALTTKSLVLVTQGKNQLNTAVSRFQQAQKNKEKTVLSKQSMTERENFRHSFQTDNLDHIGKLLIDLKSPEEQSISCQTNTVSGGDCPTIKGSLQTDKTTIIDEHLVQHSSGARRLKPSINLMPLLHLTSTIMLWAIIAKIVYNGFLGVARQCNRLLKKIEPLQEINRHNQSSYSVQKAIHLLQEDLASQQQVQAKRYLTKLKVLAQHKLSNLSDSTQSFAYWILEDFILDINNALNQPFQDASHTMRVWRRQYRQLNSSLEDITNSNLMDSMPNNLDEKYWQKKLFKEKMVPINSLPKQPQVSSTNGVQECHLTL